MIPGFRHCDPVVSVSMTIAAVAIGALTLGTTIAGLILLIITRSSIKTHITNTGEAIMATASEAQAKIDELAAALGTVSENLTTGLDNLGRIGDELKTEIAGLKDQIANAGVEIDTSGVDAVAAKLSDGVSTLTDKIVPALDELAPEVAPSPEPGPTDPEFSGPPADVDPGFGQGGFPGQPR